MMIEIIARGYRAIIEWSDDDAGYIATVPNLPGCVSHGQTIKEAGRNIDEAVGLWMESASRHNDGIPVPDGDEVAG